MTLSSEYQLREVDVSTLKHWLDGGEVVLIDVREPGEYLSEHIPGAQLMPLSTFDPQMLKEMFDVRVVLQCQSGNRSTKAAQKMFEAGFTKVMHLQGGLPTWKAAGYPTKVRDRKSVV